jgi:hypothetical protein
MTFSVRQFIGAVVVSFSIGALRVPVASQAGQPNPAPPATNPPTFMLVEFMKVGPGKENDWVKLERETWKPMHEMRVRDGSILSWAAIAQTVPGDESNGPVVATVTTFRGWPDPTKTDWTGLIKRAHPQTQPDTIFDQAEAARKIVRSEIWTVIDQTGTRSGGAK